MAKSLKQLVIELDDVELCNSVFTRIVEYHGDDIDASAIGQDERVVLLVWHVSGIIGNGGFRYLFEGNLPFDPYFALTAEAFRATGCTKAAEAVRKTLAMFPNSRPPRDIEQRLRYYLSQIKGWPTDLDMQFFDAKDELTKHLADHIRSHADALAHLDGPSAKRPRKKHPKTVEETPKRNQKAGPTLADLPHWARVAFAARCARQVFPLLAKHWPGIPSHRSNAIRLAIDLAGQSAAEGHSVEGLKDAVLQTVMAAGAALATRPEFAQGELPPENAYSGTIASFVAKAAEKAAESARAASNDSLLAATEAWNFATNAAVFAEEEGVSEELKLDLANLHRTAVRSKWTDRTKICSDIWSVL
jgi:Domain of unknown function (DUF4375)